MKKQALLLFALLCPIFAYSQGVRYDIPPILTSAGKPVSLPVISLCPGTATISGAACSPATGQSTTDITTSTLCPVGSPVTLTGLNTCQANGDTLGNAGFWLKPGAYIYCITGSGITGACYNLTVPIGTTSGGTAAINGATINNRIYVGGGVYPSTQTGVQQAFTDACNVALYPTGSTTVYLPPASIALHNQANQLLTVTCPLLIDGAGGLGGTNLVVDAGVASTVCVIRYQPTGNTNHFHIQNVTLSAAGATTAGDGLCIDGQSLQANTPTFVEVGPNFNIGSTTAFNGRAINTLNLSSVGSSPALVWQIHDSSLNGGIKLVNTADATSIRNNAINCSATSTNANIELTPIAGAAEQQIVGNWAAPGCPGGAVILHAGGQMNIEWNQFEQGTATTEANSAMIDLQGDVGVINNIRIIHNNLNSHNNATNMIRIDKATNTHIEDNIPNSSSATGVFILLTANASLTRVPWNDTTQLTGGATILSNPSATTTLADLAADGSEAQPSFSFFNAPGMGFYQRSGVMECSVGGTAVCQWGTSGLTVGQGGGGTATVGLAPGSVRTTAPVVNFTLLASQLAGIGNGTVGTTSGILANGNKVFVTADFTSANSAALQAITGLTWGFNGTTNPLTFSFHCSLLYSQATPSAGDQFGVAVTTTAPTNVNASGIVATNATTFATSTPPLIALNTTTPTALVTFTPAVATILQATLDGTAEMPAAGVKNLNIYVLNGTAANVIVIKRGSYCSIY